MNIRTRILTKGIVLINLMKPVNGGPIKKFVTVFASLSVGPSVDWLVRPLVTSKKWNFQVKPLGFGESKFSLVSTPKSEQSS